MHHSSTSTYIPNVIEIKETLWTCGRTFETHFIRSTWRSRPNKLKIVTRLSASTQLTSTRLEDAGIHKSARFHTTTVFVPHDLDLWRHLLTPK